MIEASSLIMSSERLVAYRGLIALNNLAITMMQKNFILDAKEVLKNALRTLREGFCPESDEDHDRTVLERRPVNETSEQAPNFSVNFLNDCLAAGRRRLIQLCREHKTTPQGIWPDPYTTIPCVESLCLSVSSSFLDPSSFNDSIASNWNFLSRIFHSENGQFIESAPNGMGTIPGGYDKDIRQRIMKTFPIRMETEDFDVSIPDDAVMQSIVAAVLLHNLGTVKLCEVMEKLERESVESLADVRINVHEVFRCFYWAKATLNGFLPTCNGRSLAPDTFAISDNSPYCLDVLVSAMYLEHVILRSLVFLWGAPQTRQEEMAIESDSNTDYSDMLAGQRSWMIRYQSFWVELLGGTQVVASAA